LDYDISISPFISLHPEITEGDTDQVGKLSPCCAQPFTEAIVAIIDPLHNTRYLRDHPFVPQHLHQKAPRQVIVAHVNLTGKKYPWCCNPGPGEGDATEALSRRFESLGKMFKMGFRFKYPDQSRYLAFIVKEGFFAIRRIRV